MMIGALSDPLYPTATHSDVDGQETLVMRPPPATDVFTDSLVQVLPPLVVAMMSTYGGEL